MTKHTKRLIFGDINTTCKDCGNSFGKWECSTCDTRHCNRCILSHGK